MSSKRWFVDRTDGSHNPRKTQCGGGSKTPDKAQALKARMRAQQELGSSNSFTVREGTKSD